MDKIYDKERETFIYNNCLSSFHLKAFVYKLIYGNKLQINNID